MEPKIIVEHLNYTNFELIFENYRQQAEDWQRIWSQHSDRLSALQEKIKRPTR